MTLRQDQTSTVLDLDALANLIDTDLLLITRAAGASKKATLLVLLAYIASNINLSQYATIESPALTGAPTTTTADPGDASTRIASTAFVDAVRAALADALSDHTGGTDPHGDRQFATDAAEAAEAAAKAYADSIVSSAVKIIGGHDATAGLFPTTGGSGESGAIMRGNMWFVSAPGVLKGKSVAVGDSFFATADDPASDADWEVLDTNLGFVPEVAGAAAAAILAHLAAEDPHGDREYAANLAAMRLRFDAAQSLTAAQALQARQNLKIARNTATVTTTSLSPQATESGVVAMARAFTVLKITTSNPARVRLYNTTSQRDADLSRALGIYPADNSGCFFEFVTSASMLTSNINKAVNGFNGDDVVSDSIAYNITNLDGSTRAITATLAFLPTE